MLEVTLDNYNSIFQQDFSGSYLVRGELQTNLSFLHYSYTYFNVTP